MLNRAFTAVCFAMSIHIYYYKVHYNKSILESKAATSSSESGCGAGVFSGLHNIWKFHGLVFPRKTFCNGCQDQSGGSVESCNIFQIRLVFVDFRFHLDTLQLILNFYSTF